jgi:hypothetical protein
MIMHLPEPNDPTVARTVIMIMLAEEYKPADEIMVRYLLAAKIPTHNGRHYSNSDQRHHYRYRNQEQSKQQTDAYRQNRADYYDP